MPDKFDFYIKFEEWNSAFVVLILILFPEKFCTDRKCLNGRCDVVNEQEVCSCYEGFFLEGDECKRSKYNIFLARK